jgi:hypothetical protein
MDCSRTGGGSFPAILQLINPRNESSWWTEQLGGYYNFFQVTGSQLNHRSMINGDYRLLRSFYALLLKHE